ncbi:MAG: hypothetical protein ACC656_13105 [Candidatus Heimdallarchaeota archaeon]
MGILLQKLYERRKTEGANINDISTTWLRDNLKKPTSNVLRKVNNNNIVPGKTYFLFYDLAGALNSSRMEQYSPILAIKTAYVENIPILWGFNFNFVPERVRINWFDKVIDRFFKGVMNTNATLKRIEELKPLNLTFDGVYRTLASIGFEYSIREYRLDLVNRAYEINLNEIDRFVSIDTEFFSGVDQQKLIEIWLAKLTEGEQRLMKIKQDILTDFEKMEKQLEISLEDLEKSKQFLASISNK